MRERSAVHTAGAGFIFTLCILALPGCKDEASADGGMEKHAEPQAAGDIRILHVANAGFLTVVDGKKVLIDALFASTAPVEPPPEVLRRLETGQAPFDSLDLILVTHNHPDHLQAESVLRALAHNPNAVFLSTPQAVSELQTLSTAFTPVRDRIRTVDLPVDSSVELEIRGLRVRVMSTGHGSSTWVQNYMYLVSSFSGSIFHEGDGEVVRVLDKHDFGPDSIDVAFVQVGLLTRPEFLRRIEGALRPRHLVPIHINADRRAWADTVLGPLLRTRHNVHYLRECLAGVSIAPPQQSLYLGLEPPGTTPELFAPNVISTGREHSAAMVTPDQNEIWFARLFPAEPAQILSVKLSNGVWSPPETAPFSGVYPDLYPSLTADGRRVFFTSQRPLVPGDTPLPRGQGRLWSVERTGTGWSDPALFDIDTDPRSLPSCVSVATSGNVYFGMRNLDDPDLSMDIYRVRFERGRYLEPERLEGVSSPAPDHSPFVAPDESYLIWSSFRGGFGRSDLFISFREADGSWSEPRNLGPRINSDAKEEYPYVTPDGRFLFFNSNRPSPLNPHRIPDGTGNIFWVDARPSITPSVPDRR